MAPRKKKGDGDAAPKARKPKPDYTENKNNVDEAKKAEHVGEMVRIEQAFNQAKEERKDMKADLIAKIKDNFDRDGVDPKEVERLTRIALDEQKARDEQDTMNSDMDAWDAIRKFDEELFGNKDDI